MCVKLAIYKDWLISLNKNKEEPLREKVLWSTSFQHLVILPSMFTTSTVNVLDKYLNTIYYTGGITKCTFMLLKAFECFRDTVIII
jgi:hypothetical protein